MNRIIIISVTIFSIILLSLTLAGCDINASKNEWNNELKILRVGDSFYIENITEVSYRVSYENEFTITYVFEHPRKWIWMYITIDKTDINNKIKTLRTSYSKHN